MEIHLTNQEELVDYPIQEPEEERSIDSILPNVPLNPSNNPPSQNPIPSSHTLINRWLGFYEIIMTSSLYRKSNHILCIYMITLTTFLGTVALVDWNTTCSKHIKIWIVVQICVQILLLMVNVTIVGRIPPTDIPQNVQEFILRRMKNLFRINKVLLALCLIWFIVGYALVTIADDCNEDKPFLFRMCRGVIVLQFVLLGVLTVGISAYYFLRISNVNLVMPNFAPAFDDVEPSLEAASSRGATQAQINTLEVKKFTSDMISKDDASCAICLSTYEDGEEIRFLPCQKTHHFHKRCVDQWLFRNKSCPMCKREIDTKK